MTSNNDKKLVGVRITEERRKEWDQFVEESSEFNTMAQMMRVGVERLMNDSEEDSEDSLEELKDQVEILQDELKRTRTAVEDVPVKIDDAEDVAEEVIYKLQSSDFGDDDEV